MEQYFFRMTSVAPYAIAPQWKYTMHLSSEAGPDHLIRMEDPTAQLDLIAKALGLPALVPRLNRNSFDKLQPSSAFKRTLEEYYRRDIERFGY
mgnify:CR=1 FL=1